MKVAMYLRKSRAEEQADLVETLRRHRETLTNFAQKNQLSIANIFEEVVSGESLFARPRMMALLEGVEAQAYEAVLCMDIDRLGRGGMRDQGIILDTFKYSGTKIVTPDKTYDLNDEMDEELTEFKTFMSRREYKIINKRLRRGLRQTLLDGGYVANAPYGYQKAVVNKKPTLAINTEESSFVQMIFKWYVEERMGTGTIADTLNLMGARPRRSLEFCRTSVGLILKNPVYIGQIVWDRKKLIRKGTCGNNHHIKQNQPMETWLVAQGIHPPIVTEDIFIRAQHIMCSRAHPPAQTGTIKNALAGLVRCAVCGKLLQRRGGNGTPYLLCPTPGCVAGAKAESVEAAIIGALREKFELLVWSALSDENDVVIRKKALLAANREYDALLAQQTRLHELLERGIYDETTFCSRREHLAGRISQVCDVCGKWEIQNMDAGLPISVYEIYSQASAEERNALLKSVLDQVEYDKKKKSAPLDFTLILHFKTAQQSKPLDNWCDND